MHDCDLRESTREPGANFCLHPGKPPLTLEKVPQELDVKIYPLHLQNLATCAVFKTGNKVGLCGGSGEHISLSCFSSSHCFKFIHSLRPRSVGVWPGKGQKSRPADQQESYFGPHSVTCLLQSRGSGDEPLLLAEGSILVQMKFVFTRGTTGMRGRLESIWS